MKKHTRFLGIKEHSYELDEHDLRKAIIHWLVLSPFFDKADKKQEIDYEFTVDEDGRATCCVTQKFTDVKENE